MNSAQKYCADTECHRPSNDQHNQYFGDDVEGRVRLHGAKDFAVEEENAELQQAECEDSDEVEEVLDLYDEVIISIINRLCLEV
jgi:hypothetical protein